MEHCAVCEWMVPEVLATCHGAGPTRFVLCRLCEADAEEVLLGSEGSRYVREAMESAEV